MECDDNPCSGDEICVATPEVFEIAFYVSDVEFHIIGYCISGLKRFFSRKKQSELQTFVMLDANYTEIFLSISSQCIMRIVDQECDTQRKMTSDVPGEKRRSWQTEKSDKSKRQADRQRAKALSTVYG
ncbi:hypothetical protein CEXT_602711 [Caerostris extrusa]|uniref:Uncharacterized protein n=1 Tax=Caerostris extrusa TaxID=172846 RepID=A0AAV4Y5T5_CAEEX|nr:hypothetical protein CEXT_602711 [Caerostris extrusa]